MTQQNLIRINFIDFSEIMEKEVSFHGKRFYGDSDEQKESSKTYWFKRYYNSLSHVKASQLISALSSCTERFTGFPTIPNLLKFCPIKQVNRAQEVDYSKPMPMTPRMKAQLKHINSGPSKIKIGQQKMDSMKNMCMLRFSGDWSETFARWDLENEARMDA